MSNAYGSDFWSAYIWANDSKTTYLSPSGGIHEVISIHRLKPVNDSGTFNVELILSDKNTAALGRGAYIEVWGGRTTGTIWIDPQSTTTGQTLWCAGYIDQITKITDPDTYSLQIRSPMQFLSGFCSGDDLFGSPGTGYWDVLQYLNGINPAGSGANPGQKGVLTGSGWRVRWVDGTFTVTGSTTTAGTTNLANTVQVQVTSSTSITANLNSTQNNAIQIGNEWYHIDGSCPDGAHIQIKAPGLIASVPAGTAVNMASYVLPGAGQSFYTANDTALHSVLREAKRYNFFVREAAGSLAHNGILEAGYLADSSGLQIWGGTQLAAALSESTAFSYHANAATAQANGYSVITAATRAEDTKNLVNVSWPYGHGGGRSTYTIRPLMGGDPPGNGWASYVPYTGGRQYYLKNGSKTTWQGNTFEYIAMQRNDGEYQFGVINRGLNLGVNQAPPYGIHELAFKDRQTYGPDELLAEALGMVEYNANPITSYTFGARHPNTSQTGMPNDVLPGQTIDIRYTGEVHDAIGLDTNAASLTYGQFIGIGSYQYLKFPTVADPTDENGSVDPNLVKKMSRCTQVEDWWDTTGFRATYTMGRNIWKSLRWEQELAHDMETGKHPKDAYHEFTKKPWDKIPFLFSNSPALAWEDPSTHKIVLQPGAIVVSDVPNAQFFGDHHAVEFTATFGNDASDTQWLDFWFSKPLNTGTLTSINAGTTYGVFRLAGTGSGQSSGFFTTSDGATFTHRGRRFRSDLFNGSWQAALKNQTFRVRIQWSGGHYHAQIKYQDTDATDVTQSHVIAAQWDDVAASGSQVLNFWGAIGWNLRNGTPNCTITDFAAHPHVYTPKTRTAVHPHNAHKYHWVDTWCGVKSYNQTSGLAVVEVWVGKGGGKLVDDKGDIIANDDDTLIQFNTAATKDTVVNIGTNFTKGNWLVYNSHSYSVNDGTFTTAAKSFGEMKAVKTQKPSWDGVYILGKLSNSVDPHSRRPYFSGHHVGAHQGGGRHTQPKALGHKHINPTHHSKKRTKLTTTQVTQAQNSLGSPRMAKAV